MYSELGRSPGASLFLRGISPNPCALKGLSDFAVRNPGPGRSADADFLVKSFGGVLVRGISLGPCACCASAPSQPRHFVTAPFRGKPAPAVPPPGVSAASMSAPSRCRSAAPLVRPFRESLSDFAGAKSRDRAGALMSTINTGHIPGPLRHDTRAVADNIVVHSKLKVLPVPICGQVKPLSACLSVSYLPPPDCLAERKKAPNERPVPEQSRDPRNVNLAAIGNHHRHVK